MNNVQLPAKLFKVILWTSIWDKHFRATLKFVEYFLTSTLIGHLRVLDRVKVWILTRNLGSPFSVSRTKNSCLNSRKLFTQCWLDVKHELTYGGFYMQVQWRALDEINSGVCDGMTYLEIKETMPEDYLWVLSVHHDVAYSSTEFHIFFVISTITALSFSL